MCFDTDTLDAVTAPGGIDQHDPELRAAPKRSTPDSANSTCLAAEHKSLADLWIGGLLLSAMYLSFEGTYKGATDVNHDAVRVVLELTDGRFVLNTHTRGPFNIESDGTVRGSFVTRGDGITLRSREYAGYTYETVMQESSGPSTVEFDARAAGPESDRTAALEIRIGDCPFPLLLARVPLALSEESSGFFIEPYNRENERRSAEWHAGRAEREAASRRVTAIGQAGTAFKKDDYKRVVELLEPIEEHLAKAERKKLDIARKRLE